MTQTLEDPRRRKLLYRAQHRGFKEADLVIGSFAAAKLATLSEAQVDTFETLLEVPDQELFAWIIGRAPTPAEHDSDVMEMLRAFPVAEALSRGAG